VFVAAENVTLCYNQINLLIEIVSHM